MDCVGRAHDPPIIHVQSRFAELVTAVGQRRGGGGEGSLRGEGSGAHVQQSRQDCTTGSSGESGNGARPNCRMHPRLSWPTVAVVFHTPTPIPCSPVGSPQQQLR